jgi:hypothetical protein
VNKNMKIDININMLSGGGGKEKQGEGKKLETKKHQEGRGEVGRLEQPGGGGVVH